MGFFADAIEAFDGGGDVLEEVGFAEVAAEVSVGAQGLHKALGGAEEEGFAEFGEGEAAEVGVVLEEFLTLGAGEVDVGVVEEGGEVVFGEAEAEALVVDEPGAVFVDEDVLALEVAMDEAAGQGGEASAEVAEGLFDGGAIFVRELFLKVAADEVVEEVVLLPEVEGVVEGGFEFDLIVRGELGFGDGVDFGDFLEGGFIPGAEDIPGFVPVGVEVVPAEVLEPDAEAAFVVMEDGGDMDAEGGEALGGGGEFGVVAAGVGVDHEDHGLLAGGGPREAVVVAIGAAFEDGLELTGEAGQFGELLAGEDVESFVFWGHGEMRIRGRRFRGGRRR